MSAFVFNVPSVHRSTNANQMRRVSCSSREAATAAHRTRAAPIRQAAQLNRRTILQLLAAIAVAPNALSERAHAVQTAVLKLGALEKSDEYGYSFQSPPDGWSRSTASLSSFRVATVFVNDNDEDSNINMVATPVPGDFQKLTSFGTLDNVLQTIIPKSGKDIEGNLIAYSTDTDNNAYIIEYTITSRGVKRHLLTVFSLQPGRYLLTLTAQAKEQNWKASEAVMRGVIDSYKLQIMG